MKLKVWGACGSIPSPLTPARYYKNTKALLEAFAESNYWEQKNTGGFLASLNNFQVQGYGGDTTCVELINDSKQSLIIDGGSGVRLLGDEVMAAGNEKKEFHIYMTHYHWDHVIGLPFFTPFFIPGNTIHFYGVEPNLEECIKSLFKKPFFPVPFEALQSDIKFHQIPRREPTEINGFKVTPYMLDHPDPCWGAKIESDGKVYAHCVDTEATRAARDKLGDDLPLYQGVDLMYWDAQYSFNDLVEKVDWGHAASTIGLDIAFREGIKKVIFTHHDPSASSEQIFKLEVETSRYHQKLKKALAEDQECPDWEFAFDGFEIEI